MNVDPTIIEFATPLSQSDIGACRISDKSKSKHVKFQSTGLLVLVGGFLFYWNLHQNFPPSRQLWKRVEMFCILR